MSEPQYLLRNYIDKQKGSLFCLFDKFYGVLNSNLISLFIYYLDMYAYKKECKQHRQKLFISDFIFFTSISQVQKKRLAKASLKYCKVLDTASSQQN